MPIKQLLLLILFTLPTLSAQGQSMPTKLYLVKTMGQSLGPFRLYTTLNPKQPIIIPANGYLLLETDADSLGIISDRTTTDADAAYPNDAQRAPIYVKLERGQTYYFRFGTAGASPYVLVDEMSSRAFQFYRGLNGLSRQANHYKLSRSTGLQQIP